MKHHAQQFELRMRDKLSKTPGFVGADVPRSEGCLGSVTIEPGRVEDALKYLSTRFHVGELDVAAGVGLTLEVVPRTRKTPNRKTAFGRTRPQQFEFSFT